MVADRSAPAGLCLILVQLYPNYLLAFIDAITLTGQYKSRGLISLLFKF